MGSLRKTMTATGDETMAYRNLRKKDLGGVIFGCKNATMRECLREQLFGLPAQHLVYVRNISAGMPLFLFNYSDRKLHGIFEAACPGNMNINPYGWTANGAEKTQYPAQVQIRIRRQCRPLPEERFKPKIAYNYYTRNHFWFELDHAQTDMLMSLFESQPGVAKWENIFRVVPVNSVIEDKQRGDKRSFLPLDAAIFNYSSRELGSADDLSPSSDGVPQPLESYSDTHLLENHGTQEDSAILTDPYSEEKYFLEQKLGSDGKNVGSSCSSSCYPPDIAKMIREIEELKAFRVEQTLKMGHLERKLVEAEVEICILKDRCVVLESVYHPHLEVINHVVINASEELQLNNSLLEATKQTVIQASEELHLNKPLLEDTKQTVIKASEELQLNNPLLKDTKQTVIKASEELELKKALLEDTKLTVIKASEELPLNNPLLEYTKQNVIKASEELQLNNPLLEQTKQDVIRASEELQFNSHESIFLVGGSDGKSSLSSLELYHPSSGIVKSFSSMSSTRSYAAFAMLKGELFVFGGESDKEWCDTVESYSLADDQWTVRPSLNQHKGCLGGAALNDKIFAIGGWNGAQSLRDVEMLDLELGRWIHTRSLIQKRFGLAAAKLNGAIYATGGYDGISYLTTAERFDPREHSWRKIASMDEARGSHSLVVLNEKLYAVSGYNGSTLVPSVEIFDPRLGSWMRGEPLKVPRAFSAAAVVKDTIYVFGGLRDNEEIIDTVERYDDAKGWEDYTAKAVRGRAFMMAVSHQKFEIVD